MSHRIQLRVRWFFQTRFRQHVFAEKECQGARVMTVRLLHAFSDDFELVRINYNHFAH
jgi:hypothetical protein